MKLPNHLPRTVAELCSHPEVQQLLMMTFATAYNLHLLNCENQTEIDAMQVWQIFIEALENGYIELVRQSTVRN